MKNYFNTNLKKLAQKYSQKQIANDTNVSQSSITNYINNQSEPSMSFLMNLKTAYSINIDNFLFKELSFSKDTIELSSAMERFVGNYIIYYYNTSAYKGNTNAYTKNDLNYGIISFVVDTDISGVNTLKAYAQFLLNRKTAEETLNTLNNFAKSSTISDYYKQLNDYYSGDINVYNDHIFLNLTNEQKHDAAFMILNNPPSQKSYIGGIATVNSISRGREHMPCIQYSIISRYNLNITDGQIYNLLTLDTPNINIDLNVDQIIKLFKSLYINNSDNNLSLTEYQKKRIIEESIKNNLNTLLQSNIFRYAKISDMEDDKYYRIIKEELLND